MKSKALKNLLVVFAGMAFLASCGEQKKDTPATEQVAPVEASAPAPSPGSSGIAFDKAALNTFFDQYLALQKALVASEPAEVQIIANKLSQISLEGMPEVSNAVATLAKSDHLGQQRAVFFTLNKAMVPLLEAHLNSGEVYQQFCPMAFENTGAFWFSDSEEILNPYFGDAMLRCGKVERTFGAL